MSHQIRRMERELTTLRLLQESSEEDSALFDDIPGEVYEFLDSGQKEEAVKAYKKHSGMHHFDAMKFIDQLDAELNPSLGED